MLFPDLANKIVREVRRLITENIIIIDINGTIIASTDQERLGSFHEGALRCAEQKKTVIITNEDEQYLCGVKAGINLPLLFHDEVIGVIGITGDPENISQYGEILRKMTELLIHENYFVEQLELEQRSYEAFVFDWLQGTDWSPSFLDRAKQFVAKIKDISSILVELDFHKRTDLRLPPQVITYQDSCHLRNVMRTSSEPRKLLQAIQGITYKEMKDADRCCGSAGIYNIVHSELSMEFLDYKMERVHETEATTIVTANPGCLLQMKLGIEREGLSHKMQGVHIVDLLLEAVTQKER